VKLVLVYASQSVAFLVGLKEMVDQPSQPQNKLEHPCFPQPADGSVRVWRYLDLAKFIWLIENQKLYLSGMDLLNDPHEGSRPKFLADNFDQQILAIKRDMLIQNHGSALGEEKFQADLPRFIDQIHRVHIGNQKHRRHLCVSCWHLGNPESEAMWRLYCPGNNGVAIQTSYNKLVKSTSNDSQLYIGCVRYIDYEFQGFPEGNIFYPAMHKRISFAHEQEVRLIKLRTPDNWGFPNEFCPPGISIDWPLEPTIDGIYVTPYAPEYFYDVVCAIVRSIAPNLKDRVHWSKMRAAPVY
jgi:hypothetical protein